MKLNLGCGTNRLTDYINIDMERSCEPDLVCDFTKEPIPFDNNTASEVVMFHVIEHIPKRMHEVLVSDIWRVLIPGGIFIASYPEFKKCAANWISNEGGQREFWEATIYGRQLYPSDYHVCAMDSSAFKALLRNCGFINITYKPEPDETYNSFITATKDKLLPSHMDEVLDEMMRIKLVREGSL